MTLIVILWIPLTAAAQAKEEKLAQAVIKAAGIQRGFGIHLGFRDGKLLYHLAKDTEPSEDYP